MRFRDILFYVVCILLAAGLFYLAVSQLDGINAARSRMKLICNEPLENAPPSLAFATVAMGAFRGLIVDILWIRADQLKEEGQFFDAKQLAEWITILQPRFPAVWDFQAWNMAYNISVAIPASRPQERWQWVKNGYELLRDKGIVKNSKSISLYRSLGWIFQHKIGGVTDDVHKYYKLRLYHLMKPLIDPQTEEFYQQLAEAPKSFDEMLRQPDVVQFLNALAAADKVFSNPDTLINNYLSLRQSPGRYSQDVFDVIDKYRSTDALKKFDVFAKAYYLRHTLKLDPELMDELNHRYGPIDYNDPNNVLPLNWTHADAHAIYWAALGLKMAGAKKNYSIDELNTDRMVFQSLQNLYRRGKMVVYSSPVPQQNDPCSIVEQQSVFLFPDLRMFDRYDDALRAVIKKYTELGGNIKSLHNARRNMLKRAVLLFYQAGDIAKAAQVYNLLRKDYPGDKDVHFSLTEYARNRLMEELGSIGIHDAREIISLMLREAYYRYAVGNDDEAFGREKMAKQVYDYYQRQYGDEDVNRVDLPDFNVLRYIGLTGFLNDRRYPEYVRENLFKRMQIERPKLFEKMQKQHEHFTEEMKKLNKQDSNE